MAYVGTLFSTAPLAWRVLVLATAVGVLLLAGAASAAVVRQHYEFAEPIVKAVEEYHTVSMEGALDYGAPGEPVLPMAGARVLLPPGEVISSVRVIPGEKVLLNGTYVVEPGRRQYPLSFVGPIEELQPNEVTYSSSSPFPGRLGEDPNSGLYRGYRIATLALHPVEYIPSEGRLSYFESLDVEITTTPSHDAMVESERMIRHDETTRGRLSKLVDNPMAAGAYDSVERVRAGSRALNPDLAYTYVIITTESWDDYLDPLVEFETQRGHKAGMFLVSWILANYTAGVDDQDDIRDFVIDAYDTWDIDYVLLVGDAMDALGVPHRGLYANAYGEPDEDIPGDLYYGCLDGNWNNDGDGRWGEPNEADLYHEVGVGRACGDSAEEVQNFVTKVIRYQDEPIVSESDEALMVGELLWDYPLTYGGDYKDQVMYGGTYDGYTTTGFPPSMNVGTLYDKNSTWSKSQLITLMENGLNIVNHLGHCNVQYSMKMSNSDIPSFDNDGTVHSYNVCYSQGCYNGSMDNRGTSGGYGGDCFAEEFQTDDDGAVVCVMNSRYGWGDPGGTNGSSQYFDREFFDAMFDEGIYPLADVNDDSKMDVIWAIDYGANRWCFYELNVFGDPAMHMWTDEPGLLDVTYPPVVFLGQPDMEVFVNSLGGGAIEGAQVTIYTDDYSVYDTGLTDASGHVTLHPNAENPGTLHIKATAHDHLAFDGESVLTPPEGPYVAMDSYLVDDDQSPDSFGNGDGIINAGETIELVVTVRNVGVETAYDVAATLTSTSSMVTITDETETFGDVAPDQTATCDEDYDFVVSTEAGDGEVIPFTLVITASGSDYEWESRFNVVVAAPILAYAGHSVNVCVKPGVTIALSLELSNMGSSDATGVTANLATLDPYVSVTQGSAGTGTIAAGGTATLTPAYVFSVAPDCPEMHEIQFDVSISADWGYQGTSQVSLVVAGGDFSNDVESGVGTWTHGNVTPGFADQWHIETYRNHSPTHSWKFGGSGSGAYTDTGDGALYSPWICLGAEAELTFWHWMEAEEESPTSAWDCGLVQMTSDGGTTWEVIEPAGGYTHLKNSNTANPLPEGTPCWSGLQTWSMETFDLSAYEGETVRIRFRFASDGYVTEEGWYVDDIQLNSTSTSVPISGEDAPKEFALRQNSPNPFNPTTVLFYQLPEKSHVNLAVYNVAGRHVKTLVDGEQEPGYKTAVWDGTDDSGKKVASGVYMYRMEAGGFVSKRSMVLLK